jgi:hypothetical protein
MVPAIANPISVITDTTKIFDKWFVFIVSSFGYEFDQDFTGQLQNKSRKEYRFEEPYG